MSEKPVPFPRYTTRGIELPLSHPTGESEVLRHAINRGEWVIDRLADLLRPGTPQNPFQAVPVQRLELIKDRPSDFGEYQLLYRRYKRLVEKVEEVKESIAESSEAVADKRKEVSTFLEQALGRIEDSVRSLREMLESASVEPGKSIPLRTQADLIDAIKGTIETAVGEVREAADKIREVVRDIDRYSSRVHN